MFAALQPLEEQRHKQRGDKGGGQHAAKYAGAHRLARARAGPGGLDQRKHAQHKGQRGHDDGPQAQPRRLNGRIGSAHAFAVFLRGKLDNQDGVFRRQPNQHHQANLKVNIVGQCRAARWR